MLTFGLLAARHTAVFASERVSAQTKDVLTWLLPEALSRTAVFPSMTLTMRPMHFSTASAVVPVRLLIVLLVWLVMMVLD